MGRNETDKSQAKIYSSGSSAMDLSTNTLDTNIIMCEDWIFSIDLKLTKQSAANWRSVLSFQVLSSQPEVISNGTRMLAVLIRQNESNFMLMVDDKIHNNTSSYTYNITENFNNWINLKISQTNGVYEIRVDYKQVYNIPNSIPNTWYKASLVPRNETGYIPVVGHYRNFDIITCPRKNIENLNLYYGVNTKLLLHK